jgi:membrane protease YdiL (CAAX protease family)
LFAKGPGLGWRLVDAGRVLLLVAAMFGLLVIPYLWVLPIHYFGTLQKAKGKIFTESPFHWGLKHFWLVCSLWLITDFLVGLLLDYPGFISNFNDAIVSEGMDPVSLMSANQILVFCTLCAAFTIPFLSWKDVGEFFRKVSVKQIMSGVGLALLLRFGLALYYPLLVDFGLSNNSSGVIASVVDNIVSVNQYYNPYLGFFFVVVLVPFYEEVLFRGIFLSACQRNMKFALANSLQSLVFAAVHNDLKLIPFYFAFGMIAGFFRQKTQSLTIGTSMHMTNNLIAFVFLLVTRS